MTKRFKAAVIGGSGYAGGEMIRRLLIHPEVELVRVASIDLVGAPVSAAHPNLSGFTDLRFEDLTPEAAAEGMDIVLLGLPSDVSARMVPNLLSACSAATPKVVDLSGAFRLNDVAAYEKFYGGPHPAPELLDRFVYGLPELNRDRIRRSACLANPGCFATTIELGLLPLARRGWLQGPIETVAMTGSSGSGAAPKVGTHHPVRSVNLKTYKTLVHQHAPEINETLLAAGAAGPQLQLVPVSAPLSRGLFASSFAHVDAQVTPDQIHAAFAETFADEPFVRVPSGRLPEVAAVASSNYAEVGVVCGEVVGGRRVVTCISALDNLIKGGAGQAIQNLNLLLGLDERLSLEDPGSWP